MSVADRLQLGPPRFPGDALAQRESDRERYAAAWDESKVDRDDEGKFSETGDRSAKKSPRKKVKAVTRNKVNRYTSDDLHHVVVDVMGTQNTMGRSQFMGKLMSAIGFPDTAGDFKDAHFEATYYLTNKLQELQSDGKIQIERNAPFQVRLFQLPEKPNAKRSVRPPRRSIGQWISGKEHQVGEIRKYRDWLVERTADGYVASVGNALKIREKSLRAVLDRIDEADPPTERYSSTFDESKHPRADDGKFGEGGGGGREKTGGESGESSPTPQKAAVTETPEFKKWFGESKVVDGDGNPLVVYHGSYADFNEFDPSRAGERGFAEGGIQFTDSPSVASGYAGDSDTRATEDMELGSVYPVFLKMSRPMEIGYDIHGGDYGIPAAITRQLQAIKDGKWSIDDLREFGSSEDSYIDEEMANFLADEWEDKLPDGFIITEAAWDDFSREENTQYIVLDPTQIKSAIGNRGTFDPADPRINYSLPSIAIRLPVGPPSFELAAERESYAKRALKSSPGQKGFAWDESAVKRDDEGKFAEQEGKKTEKAKEKPPSEGRRRAMENVKVREGGRKEKSKAPKKDLFGEWRASLKDNAIVGYRGVMKSGGSFGATEGNGVYIMKESEGASFFSETGKTKKVKFLPPENPLLVDDEPLHILWETDESLEPIKSDDSDWLKACKTATQKTIDDTDGQYDHKVAAYYLTETLKVMGYDSVVVKSGGDEWVVLFNGTGFEDKSKFSRSSRILTLVERYARRSKETRNQESNP